MTRFSCTLACQAGHFLLDGQPRPLAVRQPIPAHPVMVDLSGTEVGEASYLLSVLKLYPYLCLLKMLHHSFFSSQVLGKLEEFLRDVNQHQLSSLILVGSGWYLTLSPVQIALSELSRHGRGHGYL